jgi:hypothetical protein
MAELIDLADAVATLVHDTGSGCGWRILAGLAYELKRRGAGYGVVSICIGDGQGLAVVLHA